MPNAPVRAGDANSKVAVMDPKEAAMEVIWQGKADNSGTPALRLIMNADGLIMFQQRAAERPEWTDVDDPDEIPTLRDFLFGEKAG